jgi:hypothetical protein
VEYVGEKEGDDALHERGGKSRTETIRILALKYERPK